MHCYLPSYSHLMFASIAALTALCSIMDTDNVQERFVLSLSCAMGFMLA
jgi:hypothetical protein